MSDENEDSNPPEYATLENAQKCIDNAYRLYHDALTTSDPTKAALIEIGIEELAKGLIIWAKVPKSKMKLPDNKYMSDLLSNFGDIDINSLKKYKISDLNIHSHKKKLEALQGLFHFITFLVKNLKNVDKSMATILAPLLDKMDTSNHEAEKNLNSAVSEFDAIDLKNWDKIKENGFYVDFSGSMAITPERCKYNTENLMDVFVVIYFALKYVFKVSNGMNLQDFMISPENMLIELKDMIAGYRKSNLDRENI